MQSVKENNTICMYVRLSHEDMDLKDSKVESNSISTQRQLIRDYIKKDPELAGCRLIEMCDDGFSGTHFDTRPQFMEMIEMAKAGKISCIIVKDFSRFGRDYVELGNYLEQVFPFLGIRFISVNDGYDSAKLGDGEIGGLDVAFKNLIYDFYARETSKKLKLAWKQNALKGKHRSGQMILGYEKSKTQKGKLVIEPEGAKIVREIFDMKLAGMGNTDIARNLNDRGIPAPTEYQKRKGASIVHAPCRTFYWDAKSVELILTNEKYTGTMVNLKTEVNRLTGKQENRPEEEWVKVENTHEGIVTMEEFQKVKQSIHRQDRSQKTKIRIFYKCGICGRRLVRSGNHVRCSTIRYAAESPCNVIKYKKAELDEIVLGELKRKLQMAFDAKELEIESNRASAGKEQEEMVSVENALQAEEKAKKKLLKKMVERNIGREEFLEQKKGYDVRIAELQQRLEALQVQAAVVSDGAKAVEEIRSFLDIEELTDEIWQQFIKEVQVFPDKRVKIEWKFGDIS